MYVQVIAGFLLLLGGAESLVRGAAAIARRFGVSSLMIGMTVVAFGTSAPELVVTLNASLADASGLAVGNIVGSNIANVLLIVGLTALCVRIPAQKRPAKADAVLLMVATLVFCAFVWTGVVARWEGLFLVIVFIGFMGRSAWSEMTGQDEASAEARSREAAELAQVPGGAWVAGGAVGLGLAGLVFGSNQVVEGGVEIARTFGVSDAVIGLTLVAVGTSLPELAASVVAAIRGHPDIAIGNVLGSNLFNMLLVGGIVAVVQPLPVDPQIAHFDVFVMLVATALFVPCLLGARMGRLAGFFMLFGYVAYITSQALGIGTFLGASS